MIFALFYQYFKYLNWSNSKFHENFMKHFNYDCIMLSQNQFNFVKIAFMFLFLRSDIFYFLLWLNLTANYICINCICVKKMFWLTASLFRKYLLPWVQAKLLVRVFQSKFLEWSQCHSPHHAPGATPSVSTPQHQWQHHDGDPRANY